MKWFVCVLCLLVLTGCIGPGSISKVGDNGKDSFVSLSGIDLLGDTRTIPESFEGTYNIVAVAFKREQQLDVNSWIDAVDAMIAENPAIRFYEIPLIYAMNAPYRIWLNNIMRSGIPDFAARKRTITVYTNREKFLSFAGMKTDRIYVLLLDKDGKILVRTEGRASNSKIATMLNAINTSK